MPPVLSVSEANVNTLLLHFCSGKATRELTSFPNRTSQKTHVRNTENPLDDPVVHGIAGKFGDRSHTDGFHDSVLVEFHGAR